MRVKNSGFESKTSQAILNREKTVYINNYIQIKYEYNVFTSAPAASACSDSHRTRCPSRTT